MFGNRLERSPPREELQLVGGYGRVDALSDAEVVAAVDDATGCRGEAAQPIDVELVRGGGGCLVREGDGGKADDGGGLGPRGRRDDAGRPAPTAVRFLTAVGRVRRQEV